MDVVVIFILWFTPSLVIGLALGYVLSRLDGWHRGWPAADPTTAVICAGCRNEIKL